MKSSVSFASLPEGCIAAIISLTSPKDACAACAVSSGFKSAAESDTVWEQFLPSDYKEIIARSTSPDRRLRGLSSLKELYLKLCDTPILLDEGKLSLRLIKLTGKKCYMLSARELSIVWQDNPMYWQWTSLPDSRFSEVAQLISVCWLDIAGTLRASMLSPDTNYAAHLVFKLADHNYGLGEPAKASVNYVDSDGVPGDETTVAAAKVVQITYHPPARRRGFRRFLLPVAGAQHHPREANSVWKDIELGRVFVGRDEGRLVRCRLSETEALNWKCGLIVDGIELRPM